MRKTILIFIIFILESCIPSFAPEKRIIKEIKSDNCIIEWSMMVGIIDQDFPDIITKKNIPIFLNTILQENKIDTICESTNIKDINLKNNNKIIISFYGTPKKHEKKIFIRNKIDKYDIVLDTIKKP